MHLFEGGILDKMTTAEYEIQSRILSQNKKVAKDSKQESTDNAASSSSTNNGGGPGSNSGEQSNIKSSETGNEAKPNTANTKSETIQPLNLRMLQGAFIVLMVGYTGAGK